MKKEPAQKVEKGEMASPKKVGKGEMTSPFDKGIGININFLLATMPVTSIPVAVNKYEEEFAYMKQRYSIL